MSRRICYNPSTKDDILGLRLVMDNAESITVNGVSFTMVPVKGGTFAMGDPVVAFPVHNVTVSNFIIGQTEVTQELWVAVMGSNPSWYKSDSQCPVERVTWLDCQTFISKLNQLTGKHFRLPTEAEWEFAARGGNQSQGYTYAGSNNVADVAWYRSNSNNKTHPVAQKTPNELGLYDMSGNVEEWCQDWYAVYSADAQTDPTGPETGEHRMHRGGAYNFQESGCSVAIRSSSDPTSVSNYGLRLVLDDTEVYTVNGVSFMMVPVKGGTFTMGQTGVSAPVHEVTLSSYRIGQTEVTQELWQAVMGSDPSAFSGNAQKPVENISWDDCQTFITKLNQMTGKTFRLPTEAEWEFAARGGNKSKGYEYAGSNTADNVAWYFDNIPSQAWGAEGYGTQPVATKAPNELGLYDMSGNVWEWCQDWKGDYSSAAQTDPTGPATGTTRVIRGGCWNYDASYCRVAVRSSLTPTNHNFNFGFRLAL